MSGIFLVTIQFCFLKRTECHSQNLKHSLSCLDNQHFLSFTCLLKMFAKFTGKLSVNTGEYFY